MYHIRLTGEAARNSLIEALRGKGILAVFHYVPLHLSPMGEKFGCARGDFPVTEHEAARLARLPLFVDLASTPASIEKVVQECVDAIGSGRPLVQHEGLAE